MSTPHALYEQVRVVLLEANTLLLKHDPASAAARIGMFPELVELLDSIASREFRRVGAAQELREAVREFKAVTWKLQKTEEAQIVDGPLRYEFGQCLRRVNHALLRMEATVPIIDRRRSPR